MKDAILFITDSYLPYPSSNGACIAKIVDEWKEKGEAYILSLSADEENTVDGNLFSCNYQRRPSTVYNRLFSFCEDREAVNRLFRMASEIIEGNHIKTIVCQYRPVECLLAGLKLKEKQKEKVCVFGYFLDNINEFHTASKIKDSVFFFHYRRLVRKLYDAFDEFIVLKYYKTTFESILSENSKIAYVGLPALKKTRPEDTDIGKKEGIHIVYAGSFYPDCRRPDEILCFMETVCGYLPEVQLHLYSWGCEDLVDFAKSRMGRSLVLHGRVSAEEAQKAIQEADLLLNVGNDLPYAVPGKLFEYFSTGKSIINFCYRHNDGATEDCERYGNIFTVYSKEENRVSDCVDFIKNRKQLPWVFLKKVFFESLPGYTVEQILKRRGGEEDV